MAKKPEPKENDIELIEDDELIENPPEDAEDQPPAKIKKKAINIMDPADSAEPPKKKQKETTPAVDLAPILESIEKGFASLAPKKETPKPEPKEEKGFFETLGEW